jgi:hypothetical protein
MYFRALRRAKRAYALPPSTDLSTDVVDKVETLPAIDT